MALTPGRERLLACHPENFLHSLHPKLQPIASMKLLRLAFIAALATAASALAQNASLTADQTTLAPAGGVVALTASVSYDGEPGAVGWSIALPANWSLVSVSGPNVPAIAPESGSTGTLEFAYTAVPSQRAEFVVQVRYPAGTTSGTATPTVLVRSGGRLATVGPAAVTFRAPDANTARKSKN